MGMRTSSKVTFNAGTINRNKNNSRFKTSRGTQKINLNLNNAMNHKRRYAKNNVIGQTLGLRI